MFKKFFDWVKKVQGKIDVVAKDEGPIDNFNTKLGNIFGTVSSGVSDIMGSATVRTDVGISQNTVMYVVVGFIAFIVLKKMRIL